jgi:hypothetical protein
MKTSNSHNLKQWQILGSLGLGIINENFQHKHAHLLVSEDLSFSHTQECKSIIDQKRENMISILSMNRVIAFVITGELKQAISNSSIGMRTMKE